jgi:hypothetical protein
MSSIKLKFEKEIFMINLTKKTLKRDIKEDVYKFQTNVYFIKTII